MSIRSAKAASDAITANADAVEVVGLSLHGIRWIGFLGSAVIVALQAALLVGVLSITEKAPEIEIEEYWEALSDSKLAQAAVFASIVLLPNIGIMMAAIAERGDSGVFLSIDLMMLAISLVTSSRTVLLLWILHMSQAPDSNVAHSGVRLFMRPLQ